MPFSTFGVATAVTPSVIETYFSHYLNRRPLKNKPTAHISYHEGLRLIRQFLEYSSKHAVEDLQSFTAQWVPVPTWVRTQECEVPPQFLKRSANVLKNQLAANGIEKVGGDKWWQWRRPEHPLHAEWIEMKKDYNERKKAGVKCDRVILYVHGGAYYFGSVDEHRYQMQRHARKLKARVLAPRYRLAPQFPFPCGLLDCIATYFYLLEHFEPNQILFAGDSAGGGMVLSMLVVLRDQGCPLPAGTMLLSPWVDLTHSFPSTSGDGVGDYIPAHGFHHRPSLAWPPPPTTEVKAEKVERKYTQPVDQPFDVVELPATMEDGASISVKPSRDNLRADAAKDANKPSQEVLNRIPGIGKQLEITIDDKLVIIREQIQMYAQNSLLTHPLVSPVQQPSLGGLPPMLIQVGGAELLRDEQIYLAHKAASPKQYPPSNAILDEYDPERIILNQYPPTDVQLQVWEDLCHVPHTLSFTRPAKYMFRSVAQFGAWALARAQHKGIEIMDDDDVSIISDGTDNDKFDEEMKRVNTFGSIGEDGVTSTQIKLAAIGAVGRAGDELPPFKDHMIRQRVNRHGIVFPLPHRSEIASLHLDPDTIGALKPGPVRKWLAKRAEHDTKYANEFKKVVKKRTKEMKDGYDPPETGQHPPPTALVNRLRSGIPPEQKKKGKSWGLAMWSGWGSSHDETTLAREEKVQNEKAEEASESDLTRSGSIATTVQPGGESTNSLAVPGQAEEKRNRRTSGTSFLSARKDRDESRPRSSYREVKDAGQTGTQEYSTASPMSPVSPIDGNEDTGSTRQRPTSRGPGGWGWDLSRRSSAASGKYSNVVTRPVSVHRPSGMSASHSSVPPSPSRLAPNLGDTGKEAVKVPGSVNTYISPGSSRPHNNTVAYPFKLGKNVAELPGQQSPNPSTMTLDSAENIDSANNVPKEASGVVAQTPPHAAQTNGEAVEKQGPDATRTPTEDETAPAVDPVAPDATTLSTARPVSAIDNPSFNHLKSPSEDPVSPIDSPTPAAVIAATAATNTYTYAKRHNKFESRDSRLGFLGADGMPTSAFPVRRKQDKENDDMAGEAAAKAPFKIRNPVYDPRAVTAPTTTPEKPTHSPESSSGSEATKVAPFKLRHTVYDPKVAPLGSKPPTELAGNEAAAIAAATAASHSANGAANREVTKPPSSEAQHAAAAAITQAHPVTHNESTISDERDFDELPPPPPPPKDDPPRLPRSSSLRKPLGKSPTVPITDSNAPPMIGALDFESSSPLIDGELLPKQERPQLESFVTASEGLGFKSVGSET